jgi:hypothetical protein
VKINNREYSINPDILIYLLDDYQADPENAEKRKALILDILIPEIREEDYKTIRLSLFNEIFEKLEIAQDELQSEIKKKRSQL